jgi:ketol-acid reductoisomerase
MLYDAEIDLAPLTTRRTTVVGYGSQGRAQALNLRDSGADVTVALRPDSASRGRARKDGLAVADAGTATASADVIALLLPDEAQPALYREIEAAIKPGAALVFAHGFNIHYRRIVPRADLDVLLVAPFGIGEKVRALYTAGHGTAGMVAVAQDATGGARALALAYAKALGLGHGGVVETDFAAETETDLFAEQAVLCGGLTRLIEAAYDTLTAAGYAPEIAYFSCLQEVKLMADMIYARGIAGMRASISTTAAFGDATRGDRVIGAPARAAMREMLDEIRSGAFAVELAREAEVGFPTLHRYREQAARHPIEAVGSKLRAAARIAETE